jgi:hypothetical protein
MADIATMDTMELVRKHLEAANTDQLREMVKVMAEALMDAEAESVCNAPYGSRSAEHVNQRNGYRFPGRGRRGRTRHGVVFGVPGRGTHRVRSVRASAVVLVGKVRAHAHK